MTKLSNKFYQREDVLLVAQELLGKVLVTKLAGNETAGRIVETEAYAGMEDKASHSYGGRRTKRNEVMYAEGGHAYIYLCYGIHHLFNVVTNKNDIPQAILIRALEPMWGIKHMMKRTGKAKTDETITKGPGNLSKAMGLSVAHSGFKLMGKYIFIADDGLVYPSQQIVSSPRIGVDYAGKDAQLPYRFFVKESRYVSGGK